MKLLSWNCRGIGNPRSIRMLMDLVSRYSPGLIFLKEVKVCRRKVEIVKNRIRYD